MSLPIGHIFEIARQAGIDVPPNGAKRAIRCPFHDDTRPSAFVATSNVFYCSVCTPDGGWSAKRFAHTVGIPWPLQAPLGDLRRVRRTPPGEASHSRPAPRVPSFTQDDALVAWTCFRDAARDDPRIDLDRPAYDYLRARGLLDAWEECAFGVVPEDASLPGDTRTWRRRGFLIAAPLFNRVGELVNVQARAIGNAVPKTVFPRGSVAKGTFFASASAIGPIRSGRLHRDILVGEGLTDYLALCIASPVPVIAGPGSGSIEHALGPWVAQCRVWIASDRDGAGEAVVRRVADCAHQLGAATVRRVVWPDRAQDACEVVAERGIAGLIDFLGREVPHAA